MERQAKHNRELAKYQNEQNIRLWQMQNEYNTPAQQMERFKAAGLNPNLIYGKGTAGNAQAITPYQEDRTNQSLSAPNLMSLQNATSHYFQNKILEGRAKQEQAKGERDEWLYKGKVTGRGIIGHDPKTNKPIYGEYEFASPFAYKHMMQTHLTESQQARVLTDASNLIKQAGVIDANIDNIKARTDFQKFTTKMNKAGINASDNVEWRMVYSLLTNGGSKDFSSVGKMGIATAEILFRALNVGGQLAGRLGLGGAGKKSARKFVHSSDKGMVRGSQSQAGSVKQTAAQRISNWERFNSVPVHSGY